MKVLTKGKPKAELGENKQFVNKEWLGKTFVCHVCMCRFQLEAGDRVMPVDLRIKELLLVGCPGCCEIVLLDVNNKPK